MYYLVIGHCQGPLELTIIIMTLEVSLFFYPTINLVKQVSLIKWVNAAGIIG